MSESSDMRMEIIALDGIGLIGPGDDLAAIVMAALDRARLRLRAGDILAFAQKIVSKSEGREVRLEGVTPTEQAHAIAATADKDPRVVELILRESREVLRCRPGVVIVEDVRGLVLANAGIDASNVRGGDGETVLLLPEDPDASAARLAERIGAAAGCAVGILINDSIGRAWRNGTVGTAIGVAGLAGLADLRGAPDLFDRPLQTTTVGWADELAAAASVMMGQAGEGRPVVLIRNAPPSRADGSARELLRPREMDMFR
jgi:coenzyme F420-0:L-glutamate ligase/coenzyme F420-1:gamma-L-glutamate ligase